MIVECPLCRGRGISVCERKGKRDCTRCRGYGIVQKCATEDCTLPVKPGNFTTTCERHKVVLKPRLDAPNEDYVTYDEFAIVSSYDIETVLDAITGRVTRRPVLRQR